MNTIKPLVIMAAILTVSTGFVGLVPQVALAGNNNGANLQDGGNGNGNNGCGNGNGGPNGTKDCEKNNKNNGSLVEISPISPNLGSDGSAPIIPSFGTAPAPTPNTGLQPVPVPTLLPSLIALGAYAIATRRKTCA